MDTLQPRARLVHITHPTVTAARQRRLVRAHLWLLAVGPVISVWLASLVSAPGAGSQHVWLVVVALAWLPHAVSIPAILLQDERAARARLRAPSRPVATLGLRPWVQLAGGVLGVCALALVW